MGAFLGVALDDTAGLCEGITREGFSEAGALALPTKGSFDGGAALDDDSCNLPTQPSTS